MWKDIDGNNILPYTKEDVLERNWVRRRGEMVEVIIGHDGLILNFDDFWGDGGDEDEPTPKEDEKFVYSPPLSKKLQIKALEFKLEKKERHILRILKELEELEEKSTQINVSLNQIVRNIKYYGD